MGGAHSASLGYYRPSHHRSAHCAACSWRLHYCRGRAFNAGEHSARLSLVVLLLLLSRMTVHRRPHTTWICCMYATQLWCCQSNTVSTTESRIPHTLWQILSLERYVPTDNRLWVQGYTSCFHSIYVKWIESAGARVVPIRYNAPDDELRRLAGSVNGLLFTGGDVPIIHTDSQYMHAAGLLLNHTIDSSDWLPLWGTCMGIQTLSILVAGTADVLESGVFTGVDPQMMSLNFTHAAANSRLFGVNSTPTRIRTIFQNEPVTTNLHHDGAICSCAHLQSCNSQAAGPQSVTHTLHCWFSHWATPQLTALDVIYWCSDSLRAYSL